MEPSPHSPSPCVRISLYIASNKVLAPKGRLSVYLEDIMQESDSTLRMSYLRLQFAAEPRLIRGKVIRGEKIGF